MLFAFSARSIDSFDRCRRTAGAAIWKCVMPMCAANETAAVRCKIGPGNPEVLPAIHRHAINQKP
jgi:hypothetical protein